MTDHLCINMIRTLSMDAAQVARSGLHGTPMALEPVAYCLWQRFLRFDPEHPVWPNRDRFVLSVGYASTLLYSLLHLAGVNPRRGSDVTMGRGQWILLLVSATDPGSRCFALLVAGGGLVAVWKGERSKLRPRA
jgi:hypothetical protein